MTVSDSEAALEPVEGAFPVNLSNTTQEELECLINWDVWRYEPLKMVALNKITHNINKHKEKSDFNQIAQLMSKVDLKELMLVYEVNQKLNTNFVVCTTEEAMEEYRNREEEEEAAMIDLKTEYEYKPPLPQHWENLGSDKEIENDWVKDARPRIHLTIKLASRKSDETTFEDRNVDDVKDGYVSCDPFQDTSCWGSVSCMDRGMQAVPVLVEGGTQTFLTHPNNVYIQYESRSFSEEEMATTMKSDSFKTFLVKAEDIVQQAHKQGDIMGDIREEIEEWYLRDYVEEKVETRLIEALSLSDLVFSRNKRVKAVEWHKKLTHITAMACTDNLSYDEYVDSFSRRLLTPNYILIWSTKHFIYPQLLLRCPDDVFVIRWHPTDPSTLVAGLGNGQIIIWDLQDWIQMLETGECTWDHRKLNTADNDDDEWNKEKGFIPVVHWSAQTTLDGGHMEELMDIQWIPRSIKYDNESAFPKESSGNVPQQFMSCARENYIFIWQIELQENDGSRVPSPMAALVSGAFEKKDRKKTNGVRTGGKKQQVEGRYTHLDRKWKPLYKMVFTKPGELEGKYHLMCIQAFVVVDRPHYVELGTSNTLQPTSQSSSRRSSVSNISDKEDKLSDISGNELEVEKKELKVSTAPVIKAVPTFIVAGTLQGAVFRANIAHNRINSETGEVVVNMQWYQVVHDGPVNTVSRSPHYSDLILTVGGNLLIIWRETELTQPLIVKSSDQVSLTEGCWSLSRPSLVCTSCEDGTIQCWNLQAGGNSPIHQQNISGHTITCITGYEKVDAEASPGDEKEAGEEDGKHFISIADITGTIRLLRLPRHLYEVGATEREDTQEFIQRETERLRFVSERAVAGVKKEKVPVTKEADQTEVEGILEGEVIPEEPREMQIYRMFVEAEAEILREIGLPQRSRVQPPKKPSKDRKSSIAPDRKPSLANSTQKLSVSKAPNLLKAT